MWDKEANKTSKNDDTPAEGIPELTTGCTKANDLTKNAAVESDTLVVATCVVNDDGNSAENSGTVECPTETEPSDINRLLSVVRLNDGPSTSAQLNELNKIQNSTCESNVTPNTTNASPQKSVSATATAGCTVIKDITNFSALTVATDCDELPYTSTNANVKTHAFQQSPKPIISVKYFSPIVRAQNETVVSPISGTTENRRDTNFQRDIVAGPQKQNSNDNLVCLPETDSDTVSRVPTPASQIRALSPANSSVTSMSTPRSTKSTRGRRVVCLRHMRRAPKEPEEYIDALFPHIREAHNQIRGALLHAPLTDVKDNVLLKRKILDVIRLYVSGCKNEFERVCASVILCRRLKRNIFRLLDLFHEICSSSREDPVYLYHISQLIAVYNSLEIRLSFNLTKLQKCALIHRISHVIHKHLMVKDELLAKGNILRMFLHMPDMYSARFIMEPLFNTFLEEIPTTSNNCCQRELPDKAFVQYIIVLHLWKEMLRDPLEQVELINRAQHFMCPTKTLHTNPLYANHLPTIHTRKNAVKDILNSLKFFHDLKNAAICDDILQDEDDDIEVVIDDVINKPFWDFGVTYTSETKHQRTVNLGVSTPEPVECVDLTEEDDQQPMIEHVECPLDWLAELKERASERVQADETENIICLDSDSDGELFSGSIVDPTESYQDCFGVDTDYTSLDSSSTDDKVASEDDVSPTSVLSPNGIRTYLAPKSKKQINSSDDNRLNTSHPQSRTESSHARLRDDDDRVTLGTKTSALSREGTLPLIVNTFTVSSKQNMHFLSSPRLSLDIGPERFGGEDMELPHAGDNERESRKIALQQQSRETAKDQGDGYYENDNDDEDEYHSLPSTSSSTTTNLGKVIYSQALPHPNRRLLPEDDVQAVKHSHVDFKGKDEVKQGYKQNNEAGTKQVHTNVGHKPVKKQVKFNDNPIGPTRRPQTKLPIKPAIHLNKIPNNNQHQQPILSSSPQPRFASPSSSTSSTAESLKQMAQKEHINAIATLFSSYKITKPSLVKGAPAPNSSSSTTLENSNTAEKPTHNSRKKSTMLEPRRSAPMSPHSVSSSRNHSISPTSLRENSPIITDAEVAADPKLNMKCAVVLQENEEVLKYKKQEIAFINDLLEKQREMQRQRALKRQELQNILKKKCDEGKRLMAEITEIKRQRAEAQEKSLLAQQNQQQTTNISNRKRVLVRDRKIKLKAKTKTITRSATPTRMVDGQGDAKTTENEIDKTVAEAMQAAKGDSLEAVNAKSLIDAAAITDISGEKLVTTTQMPAEIGNDLAEVIPQSPKKRAQSPSNVSEIESPTASNSIKTQVMDIESKVLQSTGDFAAVDVEEAPKANPVPMKKSANKTSLSEKPKLPIVKGKLTPATHTGCVRSMTSVRSVVEAPATKTTVSSTQTLSDIEPTSQNALLKSSLSFSLPKSSRTHLLRAPSLSPSIFMPRNRVDVRQSMRDHSSNTDFSSSSKSWFLHASARTFTKTLKVRLKRLQHLNMRSSPSYSAENNENNKSERPASTIPVFSNKSVTNVVQLEDAIKRIEELKLSILEFSPSKTERVQKLKQRLKSQLLEMDEKYGATVTKVIENVLINASREETPNPPSSTAEIRAKKAVRRKAQRKQTQHSKKLKLSGKATSEHKESKRQLDITSSKSDDKKANEDAGKIETENGAQCDSDRIEIDNATANKMAENESKDTDISAKPCIALNKNSEEEDTNCRQENCAKEQEAPEKPAKQDRHELVDEVAISICKETSAEVAMDIGDNTNTVDEKLIHDGTTTVYKKLRNKLAHGAIVTQVVDVTPGRHVKDSLLGEILVVKATSKSAVSNNIEVPKIESKTSNAQTADAEERCSTPPSPDLPCIKPSSTLPEDAIKQAPTGISNEMAAADTSLAMLANTTAKPQTTSNITSKELQNENSESLIATGVILSKISSCDSISSNLEIVPDPPTSIGSQNDSHSRSIKPIGDNTSENAKPTVAENHENRNEFVRLQVSTSSLCGDEESSSDCLLSHLSKQVRKMSDLDNIVDASTVHVIKDATMTLMSFEATPTLPTYLLNGESRDVPTPPAISTPAPTPLPILTTEVISDTEQQRHTPTPTSALLEPAKSELTLTPVQEPKENKPDRLQKSDFQTSTTTSLENEPEQVPEKNIPTVALPMLVEQELEKLSGKPLLENTINSTAPGSAISTSDHEVSSTQELVYIPSTKRSNSNTLNNSLDVATPTLVEETAMVVQNSQIDTTHHLPENSYYMRRRTRKFSDEFTLRENKDDNTVTKVALKQRRKTFSSESSLHVQFAPNTLFTTNENTLISSRATTSGSTSSGLKSCGGGSGGSSPSTTTEPVTKHTHQTRRRNHIQKPRNKTQSPSTGRSRGGGGVSELNSTFVYGCSRLQTSKSNMADSERCVVLPASAVVPPVNLGNISRAYTKKTLSQIKVFVPPEGEMCLENEGSEKSVIRKTSKISGTEATTTSRRGRPRGSLNKNSKKPKLSESVEKTKANKTAVNSSKGKTTTARTTNKRSNKNEREQLVNSAKPLPASTTAKAPARTKNADRASNRRRK